MPARLVILRSKILDFGDSVIVNTDAGVCRLFDPLQQRLDVKKAGKTIQGSRTMFLKGSKCFFTPSNYELL